MSHRFKLKLDNGRLVKIKKNETYKFILGEVLSVSFQEQTASRGERGHTHVWVDSKNSDSSMYILDHILNHALHYPIKLKTVALLQYWHIEDSQVKESENNLVEFVIERKLSKTNVSENTPKLDTY